MSDLIEAPIPYHLRHHTKADGRSLRLYGRSAHSLAPTNDLEPVPPPTPHLRWHPLRAEWVGYATHRQERTFKPPAEYCPLCPVAAGGFPGEIPFAEYEVAVFDNRFPAFHLNAPAAPNLPVRAAPGTGACEVLVYTSDHHGSLGALPLDRRALVVQAWIDRYRDLLAHDDIVFVMPFENRGEAVGVTLHHPHGQIYAFSFLPPVVEKMVAAFREAPVLETLRNDAGTAYDIGGNERCVAFVPPFARFPFESWIAMRAFHPGPWTFDADDIVSLADLIGRVVTGYDRLFGAAMPYIMVLYAAPKGEELRFPFHIQFLPFQRSADKLKYLAGCEQGAATFLADVAPEAMADRLREVMP